MLKRSLLIALFLTTGSLVTSCGWLTQNKSTVHADPSGTKKERIAYHEGEIKKYESAIKKEQDQYTMSLQKRNMSEVRRSHNKIEVYKRKINEHKQAIKKLQAGN